MKRRSPALTGLELICRRVIGMIPLLILACITSFAQEQTTNPLDGYTPSGLAPGSPVGSYQLSGFDTINPYNGGMSFNLPLLKMGGRGGAGYTMRLPIEQKWTVTHSRVDSGTGQYYDFYDPEFNAFMGGTRAGYGPGVLYGRQVGTNHLYCAVADSFLPTKTLTRFTFASPDGTEYELRDVQTDGQPFNVGQCALNGSSRGHVFKTADGSSATFISDEPVVDAIFIYTGVIGASGYLLMRDGTRYRIDDGLVTSMTDRNGNKLTFEYNGAGGNVSLIRDSLNREITIEYGVQDVAPYGYCDRITYKGFGGATRVMRVSYKTVADVLRPGFSPQSCKSLFPALNNASTAPLSCANGMLVSGVWLPDGRSYNFQYNNYLEMARVELPTGGAYEYDWDGGYVNGPTGGAVCFACSIYRRVTERRIYSDGVNLDSRMTISRPDTYSNGNIQSNDFVEVNKYNAANTLLTSQRHYYFGSAWATTMPNDPTGYPEWQEGKEYQTEILDNNGSTILRRLTNSWTSTAPTWQYGPASNPRIIETNTTLEPAGANLNSRKTFDYDQYLNQTHIYEYDYSGSLLRHLETEYLTTHNVNGKAYDTVNPNNSSPNANETIHLRSLPVRQSIHAGAEVARTTFEYDNYAADANHALLSNCPSISGFDAAFSPTYTTRGNVTATTQYLLVNNSITGSVTSYAQYNIAGNIVKALDARGYATTLDYRDNFGGSGDEVRLGDEPVNTPPGALGGLATYAFPFVISNALEHKAYAKFDYYLGQPIVGEDANGVISRGYFNDPLDRPKQVIRAANQGSDVKSQTTFDYDDDDRLITTTSDQHEFNDNVLKSAVLYDGLGRTIESRQYEGGTNYILVQTQYDALGRAFKSSNPFRPWQQSETAVWTTTAFDALGRVTSVTTPDASVKTAYSGNRVLVADQNTSDDLRRKRISETDALGRLKKVWEVTVADPPYTEALSFPHWPSVAAAYKTSYEYDALDNLIQVTQGTQIRTFDYDSLKRLIFASNPESGTVGYQYDDNGNLLVKTEARLVSAHYEYDALNRVYRRWYNGSSSVASTVHNSPALPSGVGSTGEVNYVYDLGCPTCNTKGKLISVSSSVSTYSYGGYDALGRPGSGTQTMSSQSYTTSYTYDLAGHVKTMTYPSGHSVAYNYDNAGRLADKDPQNLAFTGNLGEGGSARTYVTGISYSSLGGLQEEKFATATPIYHKQRYNSRGQLWDIRASTVPFASDPSNGDRGAIVNYYSNNFVQGGSGADNNGNLLRQENYIPGSSFFQDNFTYDPLNRLTSIAEKLNGSGDPSFSQTYSYDRWGNRTINSASGGVNNLQTWIDPSTNRLYALSDQNISDSEQRLIRYDSAGNQKYDAYTGQGTRIYDAENRMTGAQASLPASYAYDGDGHRIKRIVNGIETWQVYGIGGELLAEYAANAEASSPQKEYGYRNGELLITAEAGSSGPTNYAAAAANVGTASSSGTYANNSSYDISAATNGDRKGLPFSGNAGYWVSPPYVSTSNPQWAEVSFSTSRSINEIDVVGLQDNVSNPIEPTPTLVSNNYANKDFQVQYWDGSAWVTVPGGNVTDNTLVWRKFTFSPVNTTKIRVVFTRTTAIAAYLTELEAWGTNSPPPVDAALASNGGTATASGTYANNSTYDIVAVTNGDRKGTAFSGNSGYWASPLYVSPSNPQWAQVDLSSTMTINEIDVVGLQDNYSNPVEPTATMVSANYANNDFEVQYWDGNAWVTVPGGNVTDNNLVWRKFTFSPVTTNKIRVVFTRVTAAVAYLTELEAWGHVTVPPANVALASNVATPSASGTYANNSNYDIAAVTNGDRKGLPFTGNAGYWASSPYVSTSNPQWAEVSFSTARSINEIDVVGLQDNVSNPIEPTPTLVSNNYANKDFQVQYWDGGAWVTVPGGNVTDNNLVWRKFTFAPITTNKIRVVFTRTTAIVAYLTELEAWTSDTVGTAGNVHWLVSDHLGTPRMVFDQTGSLANVSRHDYLPFGEELYVGTGGRTTGLGYTSSDNVRQKFTQKERDDETGLDWFGPGRYYSSTQGRFTSVDPGGAGAKATNPQTLNQYAYTLNRPMIAIDPDGLSTIIVTVTAHGTGNPTAVVQLMASNGNFTGGAINGLAAGTAGRNRMTENADTPFGVYRANALPTEGGNMNSRLGAGFGTGKVRFDEVAGEVIDAGRDLIRIHGGGSDRARVPDPYALDQPLTPTQGCVRVTNRNVNNLIGFIDQLAQGGDPLDRVFIGDEAYLTNLANQRDGNRNWLYPDLRLGLGIYRNDAERDQLVQADQQRRATEQRAREERQRQRQQQRQQRRRPEDE